MLTPEADASVAFELTTAATTVKVTSSRKASRGTLSLQSSNTVSYWYTTSSGVALATSTAVAESAVSVLVLELSCGPVEASVEALVSDEADVYEFDALDALDADAESLVDA